MSEHGLIVGLTQRRRHIRYYKGMRILGFILVLLTLGLWPRGAQAAVGCSLNDPDEDIQRFFPEMTSYRVHFVTLKKQNPDGTAALERGLGTPLDPVFETADVPYSLYVVEGPQTRLGYVLGSNNRGAHGSIQVIAALDAQGQLLEVYLQKIRSPEASQFRSEAFLDALAEHSLEDFSTQASCYRDGLCDAALVADPSEGRATEDYHSILRGLAKLHWLQELLLLPLGGPAPRNLATQAEWIGNHRGQGLLDAVAHTPAPRLASPEDHSPDTPVFLWGIGRFGLVWPLESIESYATMSTRIGSHTLLLARSHSEGTPQVVGLTDGKALRPTRDVLWGDRIFVDDQSLSRWSTALRKAVYGDAAGQPLHRLHTGVLLSWREASESGLLLLNAAPPRLSGPTSPISSGSMLVIEEEAETLAFELSELQPGVLHTHNALILSRIGPSVAVWRRIDRQGREHQLLRESSFFLRDRETNSRWSLISGRAVSGPLMGAQLTAPPSQTLSREGLAGLFPEAVRVPQ